MLRIAHPPSALPRRHRTRDQNARKQAATAFGRAPAYNVVPRLVFTTAGLLSGPARAIRELLPRCAQDNLFDSTRFQQRFPHFAVTRYAQGLQAIHEGAQRRPSAAD